MKKYLAFIAFSLCLIGNAQNINDVLRYSNENLQGTARFQAMSGAFGALGGVFVFKTAEDDADWKKFALAFNYDVTQNFDNRILASGQSTEGIDNYFLNFAQGVPLNSILLQEGEFIEGILRWFN